MMKMKSPLCERQRQTEKEWGGCSISCRSTNNSSSYWFVRKYFFPHTSNTKLYIFISMI